MSLKYLLIFITGIILSDKIHFLYILPFILLFLQRKYSVYLFLFLAGFFLAYSRTEIWKSNCRNLDITDISGIEGRVISQPYGVFNSKFLLKAEKLFYKNGREKKWSGKIYLSGPKIPFLPGDYVRIEDIKLQRIKGTKNPGSFDFRKYLERKGIFFEGRAKKILLLSHPSKPIPSFIYTIRKRLKITLERYFKNMPEERILIETVSIGKDRIPRFLRDIGVKSGTYHLLVISGLHIGFLYFLIRLLTIPFSCWNNRHYKFFPFFSLIIIWIYVMITGFKIPVLRASLMFSFFLLGEIFDREISGFSSIYLACFLLLIINPFMVYQAGFQLSFIATAGILFIFHYLKGRTEKPLSFIKSYIAAGIGAQISILPLLVFSLWEILSFWNNKQSDNYAFCSFHSDIQHSILFPSTRLFSSIKNFFLRIFQRSLFSFKIFTFLLTLSFLHIHSLWCILHTSEI